MRPGNSSLAAYSTTDFASRSPWSAFSVATSSAGNASVSETRARASSGAIEGLLERSSAEAAIGGEEILVAVLAHLQVCVDDGFNRVDDVVGREARADDVADRGGFVAGTAEGDLV